jgi:tetratricopeptide (TPR) repeat protein
MDIQRRLLQRNREVSDLALELATTINNLGVLAHDQGQDQESTEWYTRAVRELNDVLKGEPQQTDARSLLAQAYAGRAESLSNLGHDSEALADWDRALALSRSDLISARRVGRAATVAKLGNYADAVAEVDRLTPNWGKELLSLAACARVYAAAASVAARDPRLPSQEQHRRAEEFAARAMELLRRSYEVGEFQVRVEVETLRIDRVLETLRPRADFIELLQKIEARNKK